MWTKYYVEAFINVDLKIYFSFINIHVLQLDFEFGDDYSVEHNFFMLSQNHIYGWMSIVDIIRGG